MRARPGKSDALRRAGAGVAQRTSVRDTPNLHATLYALGGRVPSSIAAEIGHPHPMAHVADIGDSSAVAMTEQAVTLSRGSRGPSEATLLGPVAMLPDL